MKKDVLVYSSDVGRICPTCQKPSANCVCSENARNAVLGDGNVRLRRETKGRGGKTVVVVSGLPLAKADLELVLKDLKKICGCGGTVKDGLIEIQGEHLDKVREALRKKGYQPKG